MNIGEVHLGFWILDFRHLAVLYDNGLAIWGDIVSISCRCRLFLIGVDCVSSL